MSRVLSPLLPPKTPLYVYGSLTVGSLHVVESDCSADPGIWSDLHLQRSNQSEYSHGRYAWIRGASSRPHPSRFLHLEHTPSGGPCTPRATCIPITSASHGEGLTTGSHCEPAGSDAVDSRVAGSYFTGSGAEGYGTTAPPLHQPLPSSRSQPVTPYQQGVQPPVKPKGRGVIFDTSADKVAAEGGQDADSHGRQRTHDRDNKTQPASPGRGAHERSSIRMPSKQTPHQVGECPSGATHDAPRDSTPGSTSHQCSSSTRALKDPLRHVTQFQSQAWKKDLECIFRAYYEYNITSLKEAGWNKIRDKVFGQLLPCQEEWRRIKENDPLQYMPYMEEQFYAATGLRLEGLPGCTAWIKRGSYYHSVVTQRGQLNKCPHLV